MLKIKVREKHSGELIKTIINSKEPQVLVLESAKPRFNNKTINIAQKISLDGWKVKQTRLLKRNGKKGNPVNLVQITCKNHEKQINQFT